MEQTPAQPSAQPSGAVPATSHGRRPGRSGTEYEFRRVSLPRGTSRAEARQLLTEAAEHGHWELDRVKLYLGGRREVMLRRRIVRVERSPWPG